VELHDGDRDHLRAAAGRDLLRVSPPHDLGSDDGRGQGLTGGAQQVLAAGPDALDRPRGSSWRRSLHGSDFAWAIAFVVPYAAVFLGLVVYPVAYGLWMARDPSLYGELVANPLYLKTLVNTALYVGIGAT
jgi:hypothetical protein